MSEKRKDIFKELKPKGVCMPGKLDSCSLITNLYYYMQYWETSETNENPAYPVASFGSGPVIHLINEKVFYKIDYTISLFLTETLDFPTSIQVMLIDKNNNVLSTNVNVLHHQHDIVSLSGSTIYYTNDTTNNCFLMLQILNKRCKTTTELDKIKIYNEGTFIRFTLLNTDKTFYEFYNDTTDMCSNTNPNHLKCQKIERDVVPLDVPTKVIYNNPDLGPPLYIQNFNDISFAISSISTRYLFLEYSFTFFSIADINRTSISVSVLYRGETVFSSCGMLDAYQDAVTINGSVVIPITSSSYVQFKATYLNNANIVPSETNTKPESKVYLFSPASKVRFTILE